MFNLLAGRTAVVTGASNSPQLSKEGAIPRDDEGAIFHDARHTTTADIVGDHHTGAPTMSRPGATG
jgi:hypothetical protein